MRKLSWVAAGQGLSALGTVVGLRILTQFLDPASFGTVTLALGVAALALAMVCTPLTQAGMYFYPTLAATGEAHLVRPTIVRAMSRVIPWLLAVILLIALGTLVFGSGSIGLVAATALLLFCDCWRQINLCLLNAASEHKRYGIWMALEAWGRPLFATAAVVLISHSPVAVLFAYAAFSLVLNLVLSNNSSGAHPASGVPLTSGVDSSSRELNSRFWHYALPLVPLGLLGWANGASDRYIIGGMLSLQETGIYAAAYGLASRPLLLVNSTFEQFMRPSYQNAVSAGDTRRATLLLRYWLSALVLTCAAVVIAIFLLRDTLAGILLGPQFRSGAALMPWIAAGYGVLSLSYVFERVCYARGATRRVLAIQSLSGVSALILTIAGVHFWGLIGAAAAVPAYFTVQMSAAIYFSGVRLSLNAAPKAAASNPQTTSASSTSLP